MKTDKNHVLNFRVIQNYFLSFAVAEFGVGNYVSYFALNHPRPCFFSRTQTFGC